MLRKTLCFLAVGALCMISAASTAMAVDSEAVKVEMTSAMHSHGPPVFSPVSYVKTDAIVLSAIGGDPDVASPLGSDTLNTGKTGSASLALLSGIGGPGDNPAIGVNNASYV